MKKTLLIILALVFVWVVFSFYVKCESLKNPKTKEREIFGDNNNYQFNINGYALIMNDEQQNVIKNNLQHVKPGISSSDLFKIIGRPTYKEEQFTKLEGKDIGFICEYDLLKEKLDSGNIKKDKYIKFSFDTTDKLVMAGTNIETFKLVGWGNPVVQIQGLYIYKTGNN